MVAWEMKETETVSKFILWKKLIIIWKIHSGFLINIGVCLSTFLYLSQGQSPYLSVKYNLSAQNISFSWLQQWTNDFPRQDI